MIGLLALRRHDRQLNLIALRPITQLGGITLPDLSPPSLDHVANFQLGVEEGGQEIGWQVASGLFKRGVLVAGTYSKAQVIRIEPALNIPATLLEELLNRLEDTLKEVAGKLRLGPPTSSQPHEAVR